MVDYNQLRINLLEECELNNISFNSDVININNIILIEDNIVNVIFDLNSNSSEHYWSIGKRYYFYNANIIKQYNEIDEELEEEDIKWMLRDKSLLEYENKDYEKINKNLKLIPNKSMKFDFLYSQPVIKKIQREGVEIELYLDSSKNNFIPEVGIYHFAPPKVVISLSRNLLALAKSNYLDYSTLINHEFGHVIQNDRHSSRDRYNEEEITDNKGCFFLLLIVFSIGLYWLSKDLISAISLANWEYLSRINNWIVIPVFITFCMTLLRGLFYGKPNKEVIKTSEYLADLFAVVEAQNFNILELLSNSKYFLETGGASHPTNRERCKLLKAHLTNIYLIYLLEKKRILH